MTTSKKSGGRCAVSAVVSATSIRFKVGADRRAAPRFRRHAPLSQIHHPKSPIPSTLFLARHQSLATSPRGILSFYSTGARHSGPAAFPIPHFEFIQTMILS